MNDCCRHAGSTESINSNEPLTILQLNDGGACVTDWRQHSLCTTKTTCFRRRPTFSVDSLVFASGQACLDICLSLICQIIIGRVISEET